MSASRNPDGPGENTEFSSRRDRDEPLMTGGHQPGKLVGNDAAPEFQAEVLPAGSAPASKTHQPNPIDEVPAGTGSVKASDTIGGASSADVHTGLGHPGAGQSSKELRHDGQPGRKNPGQSLEGVGASVRQSEIDTDAQPSQRALDKDEATVGRSDVAGAHEKEPQSAQSVASERN